MPLHAAWTCKESAIIRGIIEAREVLLGTRPVERPRSRGLLAKVQSLGWGVLADVPDREIVMGAVTKPWEANVTCRSLSPDECADFSEPDFVKTAWTLRVDSVSATELLGVPLARHSTDSVGVLWPGQAGSRTSSAICVNGNEPGW